MKVFIFMRYLNNFGAAKMFMWVAEHLASEGNDVTMYVFSNIRDVNIPQNVNFLHDDLDKCGFLGKLKHIRRRIKEADADVSISFLLDANVYNMFACKGLRTKSVICERNDPYKPKYYKLKFWKPWFCLADGAVYQLEKVSEYYNNIKGKTAVIPNPVMIKGNINVDPFEKRDKTIVTLGRLDIFQKRQDLLIKAFALFVQKHSGYRLIIYGKGPDEKEINALISGLNLQNSIVLAGNTLTPQESIKDAKFFVLPSDFEGIPNSLIEAMVIGLPCIATDCSPGGASLLIENKKNGLICPKGNIEALSECLCWMVEHPDEADRMGNEAKRIKERFSEEYICKSWSDYLKSLNG